MKYSPNRRAFLRRAGIGAGALLGGCGRRPRDRRVSVVLLVMDTVRARSCGAWGFERNTTPNLEAFAAGATRYGHAIATAPWTLPSHTSIFTGKYTCQHGTRGFPYTDGTGAMRMREGPAPEELDTLAERFYRAGYATGAFTANDGYLGPHYNLDQGFEVYRVQRVAGSDLIDRALDWVDRERDRPFFLFCNVMDAHSPYNLSPRPETLPGPVPPDPSLLSRFRVETLANDTPLNESHAEAVRAQYELGVANADWAAGALLEGLRRRGRYDETLVILASDHGEYLGEHMLVEHSKDIFEEAVHVPLLIKAPGQTVGSEEPGTRSLVQVPSTILKTAGLERPAWFPPALEEALGAFPVISEVYYSRDWDVKDPRWGKRFDRIRSAIYHDAWKYIHSSDGEHALYNLARDPRETSNVLGQEPAVAGAMKDRHAAAFTALPDVLTIDESEPHQIPKPSPEAEEALRALGYL